MDELLTIAAAARACNVSPRTIERAIQRGELRAAALGEKSARRIRIEWLDEWIDTRAPRAASHRYDEPNRGSLNKRRGTLRPVKAA